MREITTTPSDLCVIPLGDAEPCRGPIDLVAEATRLKFTEVEIAELRRLYVPFDLLCPVKTPQNSG